MDTYKFKTDETGIDDLTRTIVKSVPVPATSQDTEFTLEQKENELAGAEKSLVDTQTRIDDLKAEIAAAKTTLNIVIQKVLK